MELTRYSIMPGLFNIISASFNSKLNSRFIKNRLLEWTDTIDQTQALVGK
jgi:hypothetical protein